MAQMYKVFFNDSLLSLTTPDSAPPGACTELLLTADRKALGELITRFEFSGLPAFTICHPDPDELFRVFCSFYQLIEAAGGIVSHPSGRYLLIKRFGKWDFPKGKIEPGESPSLAAIREVMEECGIGEPRILTELPSTYHTYRLEGNRMLKKTHWFGMRFDGNPETIPQREEGITEARWLVPSQFDMVLENTYRSIAELISDVGWDNWPGGV